MMELRIDDAQLQRALTAFGDKAADGRKPLGEFYAVFKAKCIQAWNKVRTHGGTYRGKTWEKLADQYTRKTDGVTVPAEGGVPRVRAGFVKAKKWTDTQRRNVSTGERMSKVTGNVSGKLRRSGTRVTANSIQQKDTGELQQRLFPQRADITRARLLLGGDAPDYYEHLAKSRPVLFFLPEDQEELNKQAAIYFEGLAREFNSAR